MLFEQWLEGKPLSDAQRQQLNADPEYAAMMVQAQHWQMQSREYQQAPVPKWDRESTLEPQPRLSKRNNFAAWAIAASVVVCSLAVLLVPNNTRDSALMAQLAKQTQLLQSQQKQIDQLQNIITAQNELQQQQMYQLTKEAITTGRVERQEDITNLITYIKTQRAQDQAYLRMQLNDLAEQVQEQPMTAIARN